MAFFKKETKLCFVSVTGLRILPRWLNACLLGLNKAVISCLYKLSVCFNTSVMCVNALKQLDSYKLTALR